MLYASKDRSDTPVDWWFIYKLPSNVHPASGAANDFEKTTGWEYLYIDASPGSQLQLSTNTLDQKNGALHRTLGQLWGADATSDSIGWLCYNDEKPVGDDDSSAYGHTKGVLAFDLDSDSAFWLLHSWPKFPDIEDPTSLGSVEYGQTYLCITLESVETARYIAEQMYHRQEPQTYQTRIPGRLGSDDIFYKLANSVDVNRTDPPGDIHFFSRGRKGFRLMAKNRHWGKDFWIDLVGPHLKSDIEVETWRRGTVPDTADSDGTDTTTDALYINLNHLGLPYEWHYTKDHAKWATSRKRGWVCVADINRQTSQEKRGGGAICFRSYKLWEALAPMEQLKE